VLSSHVESVVLPFETLTDSSYSTLFQVQKISNLSVGVDGSIEKGQVFVPVIDNSPQLCFGKGAP
jgi:hypothetical protein